MQLNEAIFDNETTQIARAFIAHAKQPQNYLRPSGPFDFEQNPYVIDFQADVPTKLQPWVKSIDINIKPIYNKAWKFLNRPMTFGGAYYDDGRLFITGSMNPGLIKSQQEFVKSINTWLPDLKMAIRHELEHVRQARERAAGTKMMKGGQPHTPSGFVSYMSSDAEVQANVAGLYKQAVTMKVPLDSLIDKYIRDQKQMFSHYFPDEDVYDWDYYFQDVARQYRRFAHERYRNLGSREDSYGDIKLDHPNFKRSWDKPVPGKPSPYDPRWVRFKDFLKS